MTKIYLSLLLASVATGGALAQQTQTSLNQLGTVEKAVRTTPVVKPTPLATQKAAVWTETFDIGATGPGSTAGPTFTTANGTWTTGATNGNIWKHSFSTTSGEWSNGTDPFASTTANDGFMLFDSDSVNFPISPNYLNYVGELISPNIDLTGEASALLSVEQDFRYCCSGGGHDLNVQVSSDAGATWSAPFNLAAGIDANDDFYSNNGNSYVKFANISSLAAGNNVMLKFTWDGSVNSHYYWTLDDICILALPPDDIQVTAAYIAGVNNGGIEYGRTPEDQQDADYFVGTQVYNFGANDQTNVATNDDYVTFSSNGAVALLEADSTVIIEQTETLTLGAGTYTGTHTAISDAETGGANFGNNVGMREFAITAPTTGTALTQYSMDGIGIYTLNTIVSSLGTNSFTGGEDGLVCAALYNIKTACQPVGIRVMLANNTVAGGDIYGSIKDSSLFWAGDMTSSFTTGGSTTVTAADISAGYKDLLFDTPPTLNPGAMYAAIELYSNGNANDIRIADDETVDQPFDASAIYIPGDQSYTNGTAFGIRLLFGAAGIEEAALEGVSVYPNPSEGVITVSNDNGTANTIVVYDMIGNVVLTKEANATTTIDLTSAASGVYMVKVSNGNGSMVENVVIK